MPEFHCTAGPNKDAFRVRIFNNHHNKSRRTRVKEIYGYISLAAAENDIPRLEKHLNSGKPLQTFEANLTLSETPSSTTAIHKRCLEEQDSQFPNKTKERDVLPHVSPQITNIPSLIDPVLVYEDPLLHQINNLQSSILPPL